MTKEELQKVQYIGDGVYAGHDGYQVWIFTSNGIVDENFVALEPEVVRRLVNYEHMLRGRGEENVSV